MMTNGWLAAATVLGAILSAQGNELIIQNRIINARSLGGQVVDSSDAPVSDAQVQLISCKDLQNINAKGFSKVKTNAQGFFNFRQQPKREMYCLQLTSPGFDLLRVPIHLYQKSRDLKIILTPGT